MPIDLEQSLLSYNVRVMSGDKGHTPLEQPRTHLAQRIGRVYVHNVGTLSKQDKGLPQADGHRGNRSQSSRLDDLDAVQCLRDGASGWAADEHCHFVPGRRLGLR
jgi:hypothetical protein